MLLTIATFADDARQAADGKLSLTGAHNALAVESLPGRVAVRLVLRLVAEPQDDKVEQQVTLRIRREDGSEMTSVIANPFTLDVPPNAPVDLDQVLNLTVQFETEGRYMFDVEVNGTLVGRTPLLLLVRPELTRQAMEIKVKGRKH
jgi:hypothetical protein